ncbi:hypothetical protein JKF63_01929 [Porcisia hertigi]|uniref:Transmembrane 9 superfamily member n=1 Tax=Porcisia hertigi TaxID=2761500 RepID=A0A836HM31_9TRYP|nr:hypothetical protein JKF63_01929 [Porcisia hertigi]
MRKAKRGQHRVQQTSAAWGSLLAVILLLLFTDVFVSASITGYQPGTVISPLANAYRSRYTLSPIEYYRLPVCKPSKDVMDNHRQHPAIGEILMGNRLVPTGFSFKVGENVSCVSLCNASFSFRALYNAMHMIEKDYYVRMSLDNKPLVSEVPGSDGVLYRRGYPLGSLDATADLGGRYTLYNHLDFTIRIKSSVVSHFTGEEVVGFKVTASSVAQVTTCTKTAFEPSASPFLLRKTRRGKEPTVPFTYSVTWERSDEEYPIMYSVSETTQRRGHKIAALYGVLLTVLVGVLVALVIVRTVRKDLALYLDEDLDDSEVRDETGWKLVYGDVFRAPPQPEALATLVGAGCQIAVTLFMSIFLCTVKVVDATHRGTFLSTVIVLFLVAHAVSGFVIARLLKLFNMASWKKASRCMSMFPAALGSGVMMLNLIHWAKHSTAAIPFLMVVGVFFAWVFISLPFGLCGIYWGLKMDSLAGMARVSNIPRLIPEQAANSRFFYPLVGSLVLFIASWAEMFFALNAFWREEPVYLYGFLTLFSSALIVLCAEVSIVVTYFNLRREDYRWWWSSYLSLSVTGFYLFVYSFFFLKRSLQIRALSSIILFLGYMLGVSVMFGMAVGSIGFLGSLWLVRRMYNSIKAD